MDQVKAKAKNLTTVYLNGSGTKEEFLINKLCLFTNAILMIVKGNPCAHTATFEPFSELVGQKAVPDIAIPFIKDRFNIEVKKEDHNSYYVNIPEVIPEIEEKGIFFNHLTLVKVQSAY